MEDELLLPLELPLPLLLLLLPLVLPDLPLLLPLPLCEALPPLAAILLLDSGSIDAKPRPDEEPLIPLPDPDIPLPLPEDLPEFPMPVRDIEPLPEDDPLRLPDLPPESQFSLLRP